MATPLAATIPLDGGGLIECSCNGADMGEKMPVGQAAQAAAAAGVTGQDRTGEDKDRTAVRGRAQSGCVFW